MCENNEDDNYALELIDVTKRYKPKEKGAEEILILDHINLNNDCNHRAIMKGEFVMIRGQSGGGKSSLLNVISTIDKVSEGTVRIFGSDISNMKNNELSQIRLTKMGIVFQNFNLMSSLTCLENIELPMLLLGKLKKKEREIRTMQLLSLVNLKEKFNYYPTELSGGEQQRIAIARALANNPPLLFLDEPTGDLDPTTTFEIMKLLDYIHKNNKCTIVMVTHNPELECYADRIIYIGNHVIENEVIN